MCVSELCEEKFARAINSPPEAYNKRFCVYYTTAAKATLLTRPVAPGLSLGRGLAPAEGCDASGSEGASPFPTFVLPDNLFANMSCGYYTTFAFYVSKMCGNVASKRLDACRMMIQ